MFKLKVKRKNIIIIAIILIIFFIAYGFVSGVMLKVSCYTVKSDKITEKIRIVQLTDLHNSTFGDDNSKLISKVKKQRPDLIFMTGDMINDDEENIDVALDLVKSLKNVAPVYFSYGNHENTYDEKFEISLRDAFSEAGATIVEFDYVDVTVKKQNIRIGGISGYCLPPKYGYSFPKETEYMEEFQNTNLYKVLLCHIPVCWLDSDSLDEWDVDIVFGGHFHGGMIRIPFIGGIFAPELSWFPGKVSGKFESKDENSTLIISSGVGLFEYPRFNNPPEIVVTDIIPN